MEKDGSQEIQSDEDNIENSSLLINTLDDKRKAS